VRKLPARKMLGAMIAGALLIPYEGFTLGLGEIEVNSALNQKLKADIELLSATPEDTETIIVKLASRKEFNRAGLDRPYLLNDLRFKSEVIDGVPHIKVTSGSPIREPFLNFLVEVDWPNGHLLREYTVLLDPPVFMTQSASTPSSASQSTAVTNDAGFRPSAAPVTSTSSAPVVIPVPSGTSISSEPANQQVAQPVMQTSWAPAPVVQQQASINQPPGTYKIKAGDTAWSLANAMRPDQSITVEQMMIAMLRHNPESFIDENVNGLKRGYILRTPDYNQITAISQDEARAMVREHAALWRQYQQARGGAQPVSAMESDSEGSAVISGGEAIASQEDAYLEILSAGSGASTAGSKDPTQMSAEELRAELALARERVETERVEKEALQERVDTLEMHVDKMKGMLSIEDQELSTVQSLGQMDENQADASLTDEGQMDQGMADDAVIGEAEQELQDALSEEVGEEKAEDVATEETMADEPVDAEVVDTAGEEGVGEEIASEEDAGEEALFTDEAGVTAEAVAEQEAGQPQPVEEYVAPAPAPQVASRPAADPLGQLLNNPMLLAAAGGGLLLVVALIGLIVKRRKAAAEAEAAPAMPTTGNDLESLADDVASVAESETAAEESVAAAADDAAGGADKSGFDSDSTMILDSAEDTVITEPQSEATAEDEPRDDVIAEADVYLAYGIYQQAEELLTQAISDNPERNDYRVKLAETHYASKNAEAFTEVAGDIKERVSDDSPVWKKVLSMGQDLCADNPMFQGSMVGLEVDSLASGAAPEMDFDLGMDEPVESQEESAASDLDLSLDKPLDLPEMEADVSHAVDTSDEAAEEELEMPPEAVDEIEFDLSDTGAVEESEDKEDEFSLDIDASELDIDILDEADNLTDEGEVSLDLGDVDLGLDEETSETSGDEVTEVGDIDFGLEEKPVSEESAAADEEIDLDLTDDAALLDMDLGEEEPVSEESVAQEQAAESEPVAEAVIEEAASEEVGIDVAGSDEATEEMSFDTAAEADDDFDLSSLDDVDEISTKLDLARAYLDMGDHEGTRGILEEVIAEGNDEQKKEAADLMAKLD